MASAQQQNAFPPAEQQGWRGGQNASYHQQPTVQWPGLQTLDRYYGYDPSTFVEAPPNTQHESSTTHFWQEPPSNYLQPGEPSRPSDKLARTTSLNSDASSSTQRADEASRSTSPSAAEMHNYGIQNRDGSWSCRFPDCTSKAFFYRGCDLRKHYHRHRKTLFCRHAGCPQNSEGGFSSAKDRARHEASHNPQITCEWPDCDRLFSRMDNMVSSIPYIPQQTHLS